MVAFLPIITMLLCSIAHSIICKRLFCGKMHSDCFNGIKILQGRWQHRQKVGYCYPSGLEKTLCKWDINVPLVKKGLIQYVCASDCNMYVLYDKIYSENINTIRNRQIILRKLVGSTDTFFGM